MLVLDIVVGTIGVLAQRSCATQRSSQTGHTKQHPRKPRRLEERFLETFPRSWAETLGA